MCILKEIQLRNPEIKHRFREGNKVADLLSKEGNKLSDQLIRMYPYPLAFVIEALTADKEGKKIPKSISNSLCTKLASLGNDYVSISSYISTFSTSRDSMSAATTSVMPSGLTSA